DDLGPLEDEAHGTGPKAQLGVDLPRPQELLDDQAGALLSGVGVLHADQQRAAVQAIAERTRLAFHRRRAVASERQVSRSWRQASASWVTWMRAAGVTTRECRPSRYPGADKCP